MSNPRRQRNNLNSHNLQIPEPLTLVQPAHRLHQSSMHFILKFAFTALLLSKTGYANAETLLSEFKPCRIGSVPMSVSAECAELTVSFTHDLTAGSTGSTAGVSEAQKEIPQTLTLAIAKISARSNQPAQDPVTLLAGGPGQSATDSWPQIQAAFYPILANRDVYLIDQRGTGNSARMDCDSPPAEQSMSLDPEVVQRTAKQCFDKQTLATEWFTTSVAVRDLDAARDALDIEQWNLYGVSYGTRVAQHYLRRYPERTRSVILDAVVAPQKPLGPEIPLYAQIALDALFERCSNSDGCAQAFPELAKITNQLFDSLNDTPRTVQFEKVSHGTLESMEFSAEHLASTVRLLSYSSYGTAILPSMLYDAAINNNLAPFARQSNMLTRQLGGSLATGMHSTVFCTEDAPRTSEIDKSQLQKSYLGDSIIDTTRANCDPWPVGVIDNDFFEPVVSDVPVLALSGAVDPITPPAYAALAIESLSNSRHIVNKHQGHTQAPLGCMPTIMSQFIETANPESLNVECLERLSPPALFIDANGPLP